MNTEIINVMELQKTGDFSVKPYADPYTKDSLRKMYLDPSLKMKISQLAQQLPMLATSKAISNMYSISFPEGLPHTLTALKQGGFSTMIRSGGEFVGTASLYSVGSQAVLLSAFSAMSIVTGQYFLTEINKDLRVINQKLDKILEFLYGDKKAELLSEINFARYAYEMYSSIMLHDDQRIATISSLQEAKKVAMKDIDFYLNDLDCASAMELKTPQDAFDYTNLAFCAYDSAELAIQLYAVSSLLEAIYSQNADPFYLSYVKNDLNSWLEKCDKRALSSISELKTRVLDFKMSKTSYRVFDKETTIQKLDSISTSIFDSKLSKTHHDIFEALEKISTPVNYIISTDGDVYYQVS